MWRSLLADQPRPDLTLTLRVREFIVRGILERRLPLGAEMPATRTLADLLGVSRNTVLAAYEGLVHDSFLVAVPRKGHVVNPLLTLEGVNGAAATPDAGVKGPVWCGRLLHHPLNTTAIKRPSDWRSYPYPFVHGQIDHSLFPAREWRDVVLATGGVRNASIWSGDLGEQDDPFFVEQVRSRLLPRRGIWVPEEQVLVTLGAQHALFLAAYVLLDSKVVVGMDPVSYPDARNIFVESRARLVNLPVDDAGPMVGESWPHCDVVYAMPSHQNPTTVTMPMSRREAMLKRASEDDFVIIEDDYDSELVFAGQASPAMKARDRDERVIYIGSLSKTLAPGIRVGFLVGPPPFIEAARAARQLMMRHPPANNQRSAAHFIALGYHQRYITRLVETFRERVAAAAASVRKHLPDVEFDVPSGGSSLWLRAPEGVDMRTVEECGGKRGLLFDSGNHFVADAHAPSHNFRLGLSAIQTSAIDPGIQLLASLMPTKRRP